MFNALNRFGLPVKYAIVAALGGVVWVLVSPFLGFQSSLSNTATIGSIAVGGFIGGLIRQRRD